MRAAEILFRQQTIVRAAQQLKVFERRWPPERVRHLMMQLQESATRTALPFLIDERTLFTVTRRDRAPHLVRNVPPWPAPYLSCLRGLSPFRGSTVERSLLRRTPRFAVIGSSSRACPPFCPTSPSPTKTLLLQFFE
jgi:hypothetical protein